MQEELAQRIFKVIAKSKRIPVEKVTMDSSFEDLGIDSVDGLEIFFDLESEFGIDIPDSQLRSLRTVQQAVDGVRQLMAAKSSAAAAE